MTLLDSLLTTLPRKQAFVAAPNIQQAMQAAQQQGPAGAEQAMAQDPNAAAQMQAMQQDPNAAAQMQAMAQDPNAAAQMQAAPAQPAQPDAAAAQASGPVTLEDIRRLLREERGTADAGAAGGGAKPKGTKGGMDPEMVKNMATDLHHVKQTLQHVIRELGIDPPHLTDPHRDPQTGLPVGQEAAPAQQQTAAVPPLQPLAPVPELQPMPGGAQVQKVAADYETDITNWGSGVATPAIDGGLAAIIAGLIK